MAQEIKLDAKMSKEYFTILKNDQTFSNAYVTFKNAKMEATTKNSELEDLYNFHFKTGVPINIVQVDDKIFYNILIERDSLTTAYYENLLLKVVPTTSGDKVSGYVIKYTPSYNDNSEVITTDKYITALFGKYTNNCFLVYSDHSKFDGQGVWKPNIYGEIYCDSGGGGGSGGGDGGGSSGGDGGGSGGGGGSFTPSQQNPNPNPAPPNQNGASIYPQDIVLMPAYPLPIDEPTVDNPCNSLKNLLKNSNRRNNFNALNTQEKFNLNYETGFAETKNGNNTGFQIVNSTPGLNNCLNFTGLSNIVSVAHVHNNDYETIDVNGETVITKTSKNPSAQDLITFLGPIQVSAYQQNFPISETYSITLSSLGIFVLKIKATSFTELNSITSNNNIDWKKIKIDCDKQTRNVLKRNISDSAKLSLTLSLILRTLKDNGLESLVGMYQKTTTTNSLNTTESWKELILNENNQLLDIPCP